MSRNCFRHVAHIKGLIEEVADDFISSLPLSGPVLQQLPPLPRVALATAPPPMLWQLLWTRQPLLHRSTYPKWRRINTNAKMTCLSVEPPPSQNTNNRKTGDPCSHPMVQCLCLGVNPTPLILKALGSRIRLLKPQSLALRKSLGPVAKQPSRQPTSSTSS